jgi:adenylate kinase family enzyme
VSKIYIVGIVASGKTTLAKKLSKKLNVPWYELDCIVYEKLGTERYKRTPEEQMKVIHDIDKKGDWIFEGTYRKSYHGLFEMADKIIFLDIPLWKRKVRIFTRFIKQQIGIEKCFYKSDFKMLLLMYKWTSDFEKNRAGFENILKEYDNKLMVVYKNKDVNRIEKTIMK